MNDADLVDIMRQSRYKSVITVMSYMRVPDLMTNNVSGDICLKFLNNRPFMTTNNCKLPYLIYNKICQSEHQIRAKKGYFHTITEKMRP